MSEEQSGSESSDSEIDVMADYGNYLGYQFEPKRDDCSSDSDGSASDGSSSTEAESERLDERLGNVQWCRCGHCSHTWLQREKECVCCQEPLATRTYASPTNDDDTICITNNSDFRVLCLNPVVLRNVLVSLNNIRADHWHVDPPKNISLRYAAFRQLSWWVHGKLGAGRRRVIPACATHAIREAFPKAAHEQYEGYHSGSDDED